MSGWLLSGEGCLVTSVLGEHLMVGCHISRGLQGSLIGGGGGEEEGRLFAVPWALWLHLNEVIFQERSVRG